ncbi:MAG: aldo/keto reductase [Ignavibacteria bacterium]|jgi:aryl-alcohol dehydrogenase-like predicted oxidoreductase|nr:aldo/keto reductase [Ignavibacteria bacterium]MCU7505014.1 aldo/keto reductase [Ignavibacteria bacterium]MCU7514852.1 aldo/keto reductase [Ignavibacteria bacterium]
MNYRMLGNSGLEVSEICFGVMTFTGENGWTHVGKLSQHDADELTSVALDNGVNFFDTADNYSNGASEEMLGRALGNRRKDAIIASKCGFRTSEGPNGTGLSKKRIIEACNASLKRLNTDYIDLYQVHSFDFMVPLEETLSAFEFLIREGKVRYAGCSNFMAWQLVKSLMLQEKKGYEKFITIQAYYSLVGRDLEWEILPACIEEKIGILVWGPLHGGILTGKYRHGKEWPKDTRIKTPESHLPYDVRKGEKILQKLDKIACRRNVSISQVSLNYLLRKPGISSVIIGARNKEQLLDNIKAGNWELSGEEMRVLNEVSAPGKIYPHWYFEIFRKDRNYTSTL